MKHQLFVTQIIPEKQFQGCMLVLHLPTSNQDTCNNTTGTRTPWRYSIYIHASPGASTCERRS